MQDHAPTLRGVHRLRPAPPRLCRRGSVSGKGLRLGVSECPPLRCAKPWRPALGPWRGPHLSPWPCFSLPPACPDGYVAGACGRLSPVAWCWLAAVWHPPFLCACASWCQTCWNAGSHLRVVVSSDSQAMGTLPCDSLVGAAGPEDSSVGSFCFAGGMPPTPQAAQLTGQKQSQQQYDPSTGPPVQNAASLHTPPPQLPARLPQASVPASALPSALQFSQQPQVLEAQTQPQVLPKTQQLGVSVPASQPSQPPVPPPQPSQPALHIPMPGKAQTQTTQPPSQPQVLCGHL